MVSVKDEGASQSARQPAQPVAPGHSCCCCSEPCCQALRIGANFWPALRCRFEHHHSFQQVSQLSEVHIKFSFLSSTSRSHWSHCGERGGVVGAMREVPCDMRVARLHFNVHDLAVLLLLCLVLGNADGGDSSGVLKSHLYRTRCAKLQENDRLGQRGYTFHEEWALMDCDFWSSRDLQGSEKGTYVYRYLDYAALVQVTPCFRVRRLVCRSHLLRRAQDGINCCGLHVMHATAALYCPLTKPCPCFARTCTFAADEGLGGPVPHAGATAHCARSI